MYRSQSSSAASSFLSPGILAKCLGWANKRICLQKASPGINNDNLFTSTRRPLKDYCSKEPEICVMSLVLSRRLKVRAPKESVYIDHDEAKVASVEYIHTLLLLSGFQYSQIVFSKLESCNKYFDKYWFIISWVEDLWYIMWFEILQTYFKFFSVILK